jgi:penicillin-binding protein 1B
LAALEQPNRYTLATPLNDGPITLRAAGTRPWSPKNYDQRYHGTVLLHRALANSYNLSTVRLGLDVGVPEVVKTLHRLGLEREIVPYPAVLLGSIALSPLEVAQIYETLASGGFRTPLRAIREVMDADGKPLQRYPLTVEQAFAPEPIYLVNTALQEVVRSGTGRSLSRLLPAGLTVAGKTGTTDELRDSWFAGFSGNHLTVVWLGRDDNHPIGLSGAAGAMLAWGDVIREIGSQPLQLIEPPDIEFVRIDTATGLRAGTGCERGQKLPFILGSAPRRFASCGDTWAAVEPQEPLNDTMDADDGRFYREETMPVQPSADWGEEARDPVSDRTEGAVRKTVDWLRGLLQ